MARPNKSLHVTAGIQPSARELSRYARKQTSERLMYSKASFLTSMLLLFCGSANADEGWYRFPPALEGRWELVDVKTNGHVRDDYVGQIAEIRGSEILLQSAKGSNTYHLTFVDPTKPQIELNLTATAPDGKTRKTFRCLLAISNKQLRLVRPQNDKHPRPRDVTAPARSETIFTMVPHTNQSNN
jgi:uncharacterized protein (TIGR03067 family)